MRAQDAEFQQLVASYQNTVLKAGEEVENGLVNFLRSQKRYADQAESVRTQSAALKEAIAQYRGGLVDYNRVVVLQEKLVERQQILADAQGSIALGLIQVYRALGGGWQIRLAPEVPPDVVVNALPAQPVAPVPGAVVPAMPR